MTPNELVLTFGGLHFCVKFGENRQRNATVRVTTLGQTDRHTHRLTDANRFYYLSHAICYSYGADNNVIPEAVRSRLILFESNKNADRKSTAWREVAAELRGSDQ